MNATDLGMGKRAKAIRQSRQLTLQAVADAAGRAKSYVWEIERGRQTNPSISTLIRLARALRVSLDDFGLDEHLRPQLRSEGRPAKGRLQPIIVALNRSREFVDAIRVADVDGQSDAVPLLAEIDVALKEAMAREHIDKAVEHLAKLRAELDDTRRELA